ncbi:MAG: hypothetical protein JSV65_13380 [Armatimonadota bacterium]|nr:MAG: hypothetical protein JSV65_13380 [Armatimonadota bacterium]
MADDLHLTQEEWEALEPHLATAETHAHDEFFTMDDMQQILGDDRTTPGARLLRLLLQSGNDEAVALFRAAEVYNHELTRHGYAAAFRCGVGAAKARE